MAALPVAEPPVTPAKKWWACRRWRAHRLGVPGWELRVFVGGTAGKSAAGGGVFLCAEGILIAEGSLA
jgi:hypothetical protein